MKTPRSDTVSQDNGHDSTGYSGGYSHYESIYNFVRSDQAALNRQFAKYLEGKSVAIVGRANLHQLVQGDFIDSHDVVVRIRTTQPYTPDVPKKVTVHSHVPQEYQHLVGSKMDVFYHAIPMEPNDSRMAKEAQTAVDEFHENGGQFLCNADCQFVPLRYTLIDRFTPVRYVSDILKIRLRQKLNTQNLIDGVIVIADILSHNIKSAYITGFPCYFDKMYENRANAPRWKEWNGDLPSLKFIHEMSQNDRVSVDRLMGALFEEHCQ